jgi:four helix bundle protein
MQDYHHLSMWQRSHQLTVEIYQITQRQFPREETFGQTSQIRRAAASIPTNIAEGCGRNSRAELAQFLNIAAGSASEVEYEILLAKDTGYITHEQYEFLSKEIRDIRSMIKKYMLQLRENSLNAEC